MFLTRSACAALPLAAFIFAVSSLANAQSHYYYFKEKKPLAEYTNKLALLRPTTATRENITDGLNRRGVRAEGLEKGAIPGWWTAQVYAPAVTRGATAAAAMRDVVTSASLDPANLFASPVFVGKNAGSIIVSPAIIVGFREDVPPATAEKIIHDAGAGLITGKNYGGIPGVYKIKPQTSDGYRVLDSANNLAVRPEVRFAEPDMMFTGHSSLVPNDPGYSSSWGLNNTGQSGGVLDEDMDAPEAWDITIGSPTIKIVVIDNGVQQDHPDINQLPGIDVTSTNIPGGGPANPCDKHGTPVAGCISAIINNSIGGVGIAPACKVLSARTFISNSDCSGSWTSFASWTVDSLAWAQTQGARVSNNSNSYGFQSATIADKYRQTRESGMVHFASAGNDTSSEIGYPSSLPDVNSIAALDRTGARASFSNYGTGIGFSAPGQSIYTCDRTGADGYVSGDYVLMNGTSFACPYTAGVAALVLSVRPELTPAQVEQLLQQTSTDKDVPGYDTNFGWGAVNAHNALASLTASVREWNLY